MPRTVYLAASSADLPRAREAMESLAAAGYRIAYQWVEVIEQGGPRASCFDLIAQGEVEASKCSDVFVALAPITTGVAIELGARLASGMAAHVVGEWDHVPYSHHPMVTLHPSWEFFLARVGGGA